jgi:hypothetical protein
MIRHTNAQAWLVINSLRGGAAGGGTRMRKDLIRTRVSLAKTMEIKFSFRLLLVESVIHFGPNDLEKGRLERWYKVVSPILKNYYGTGGDMNIDEIEGNSNYRRIWHMAPRKAS